MIFLYSISYAQEIYRKIYFCQFFHLLMQYHIVFCFPVNDTLDDMLNESGDEEESDAIVNQVLDEIGIEIGAKVSV